MISCWCTSAAPIGLLVWLSDGCAGRRASGTPPGTSPAPPIGSPSSPGVVHQPSRCRAPFSMRKKMCCCPVRSMDTRRLPRGPCLAPTAYGACTCLPRWGCTYNLLACAPTPRRSFDVRLDSENRIKKFNESYQNTIRGVAAGQNAIATCAMEVITNHAVHQQHHHIQRDSSSHHPQQSDDSLNSPVLPLTRRPPAPRCASDLTR